MLIPCEWQSEPELFEAVYEALNESSDFQTSAYDEVSSYGEQGSLVIRTKDGRKLHLCISEEV